MTLINYQQLPSAVTVTTTTETAAVTLSPDPLTPAVPQGRVVRGYINITTGAAATALTIRVRQGSGTGGALVGVADTYTVAAATSYSIPFSKQDTTAAGAANQQYTVTVQQTAATGNATVNDADIELLIPSPGGVTA